MKDTITTTFRSTKDPVVLDPDNFHGAFEPHIKPLAVYVEEAGTIQRGKETLGYHVLRIIYRDHTKGPTS